MQLNRAFVFFCLVISVGAQESHRLNCYLDVLTHHTREGPCSHIILPLTFTDDVLYLQNLSEEDSVTLRKMKERNPALKILLGLGVRSSRLELMSANEAGVETFVQTVLTYLKDKSLDGLDVTWLDSPSDESSRSTELFTNLLKSLKGAFEKETQPLLLSVSVLEPADHSAVTYEERTLSQYVDFISILPAHLEKDGPYINKTVKHWQDRQVELQKLNLVLPAFLQRSRRRHHHRDHHKHDMKTETGKKDHVHILGLYLGNQVCQAIKSGQEQFITLTSLSNEQSVVAEVLQKGFGGIGVVFIDLDVFYNSVCAQITQDERAMVESKPCSPSPWSSSSRTSTTWPSSPWSPSSPSANNSSKQHNPGRTEGLARFKAWMNHSTDRASQGGQLASAFRTAGVGMAGPMALRSALLYA
ncbi:hypothetical protein QQF64_021227 [Cirrhinus molitorella]|uniref:GH18 domain-containing protein n=1 Tax=Cirrhinus molitorella TaxID=172907 RepID=A0ABR3LBH0_9TELE